MARRPSTPWPTVPGSVFFSDAASAATLSRAARDGRIRRLAAGLYSADLSADPARLVERNRWEILAALVPDALLADRTAAGDGLPLDGVLFVVSGMRKEPILLPGLTIVPRPGHAPLGDDPPWAAGLRVSSDARTLVDNLALSRARSGKAARTLSRAELGDWLVAKMQRRPDRWLADVRARALELCAVLGVPERRPAVEDLVGAAAGTRPVRRDRGRLLAARAAGAEYDPTRVERFDELARFLSAIPLELEIPQALAAPAGDLDGTLPFFEAYFSNFLEGTEFSVEEAERIVAGGEIPASRPEDAHDIIGTFRIVADPIGRAAVPGTADEALDLLVRRHGAIMSGRPEKRPGRFKEKINQAGSYIFVDPRLTEGTLVEGFRRAGDLPPGFPRAVFQLFVVSEVHPFDDGNGRVARAAMCAELSAVEEARIVVPIVFRNEYQTALRALSRDGRCDLYGRTLSHAWRWTAGMPWHDRAATVGRLAATNALVDSTDAEREGRRLELP